MATATQSIAASLALDIGYTRPCSRCRALARLRSGRSPVKPDDAVYLTRTVAWPGDRYAADRSLAGARQRLHPPP